MKKIIVTLNGSQEIDLTSEEIAIVEQKKIKYEQEKLIQEQEKQEEETKKASGKQKLLDLGLSEEEIKALIGV